MGHLAKPRDASFLIALDKRNKLYYGEYFQVLSFPGICTFSSIF